MFLRLFFAVFLIMIESCCQWEYDMESLELGRDLKLESSMAQCGFA